MKQRHIQLLYKRICDLNTTISGSLIEMRVNQLYNELNDVGLQHFKPRVYVGDEWFSPTGTAAIAVPFFLTDLALLDLEKSIVGSAEGESAEECMRLLRHEAGHCFDHAFQVSERPRWKELFGDPALEYDTDNYTFDEASLDYVRNLDDCYAQSHPEEDFAETFAVWLDPRSNWQKRYASMPRALAKLQYVDELVGAFRRIRPNLASRRAVARASQLRITLRRFYSRRGYTLASEVS
jgi:hypothetical protein